MKSELETQLKIDNIYDALDIGSNLRKELETSASQLIGFTRRSTEQVFDFGEHLERAASLLTDKQFKIWLYRRCGYSDRHARTHRAVYRNLTAYKQILIELAVGPTVLGKLSSAEPEQIKAAIEFARENGHLKVGDLAAIFRIKDGEDGSDNIDPCDIGGSDGLRVIASIKQREETRLFHQALQEMQEIASAAVMEKRPSKKQLSQELSPRAKIACEHLANLTQFSVSGMSKGEMGSTHALRSGSYWDEALALFARMARPDHWPVTTDLREWLEAEVLPIIAWATSREKNPVWPVQVVQTEKAGHASTSESEKQGETEIDASIDVVVIAPTKPSGNTPRPSQPAKVSQKPAGPVMRRPILDMASAPSLLSRRKRLDADETPKLVGASDVAPDKTVEVEQN